jgi:hypothetical protein
MLRFVSPATIDPRSKRLVPARDGHIQPLDPKSFRELRPLLTEIRTLILQGDGTGRGKMLDSGYEAEPAETELNKVPEPWKAGWPSNGLREAGLLAKARRTHGSERDPGRAATK